MEKFPPPPPNCDRFSLIGGALSWLVRIDADIFSIDGASCEVWKGLNVLNSFERRDCVANARCAWLDFGAEKHYAICELSLRMFPTNPKGPTLEECKDMSKVCTEAFDAVKNAEAWRKWGRGEAWE